MIDSGLVGSTDFHSSHLQDLSGRASARAEDAQGTSTQVHTSPGMLEYTKIIAHRRPSPKALAQIGLEQTASGSVTTLKRCALTLLCLWPWLSYISGLECLACLTLTISCLWP